jgi:hypothetical protein
MEVTGKIKVIGETETFGASGFRKRNLVVTTQEDYPQDLALEFVQDKVDLLNSYKVGESVKVAINLRGREWINPEGVAKYFNSIVGWRIEKTESNLEVAAAVVNSVIPPADDLPF